jgi:hypothetical protein
VLIRDIAGPPYIDCDSRSEYKKFVTDRLASRNHFVFIMAQQPQAKGYEHDDAWDVNWLRVDETHEVYYEQYGLKDGKSGMCASSTPPIILVDI